VVVVPPGSFWILIESNVLEKFTLNCGEQTVSLSCGEWHLLPAEHKPYAEAAVKGTQSAYSRAKVSVWYPPAQASIAG
jgi:hypothetical protein